MLYAYIGFRNLNLVLGAIPLAELLAFPFLAPHIPSAAKGAGASDSAAPTPACTPSAAPAEAHLRRREEDNSTGIAATAPRSESWDACVHAQARRIDWLIGFHTSMYLGKTGVGGLVFDATPASRHPAASFRAMTTFPILVVGGTTVMAFTSLGLFDPLVLPHLERALGACVSW